MLPSLGATLAALDSAELSSEQLCQQHLARIQRDPCHAFLYCEPEQVLEQARQADSLRQRGERRALLGIPIAVKDNFCTLGMPTTCASRMLEGYSSVFEASAVRRLREAGAVLLGKTNMDEFAMGCRNDTGAFGACLNPYDLSRSPGGSSGGSAASVAAGLCLAALGSDTGGSVRLPASHCGVLGFKPSYGRISRYGLVAFASSLDQPGVFCHDCDDAALLCSVLFGVDGEDATMARLPSISAQLHSPEPSSCTLGVLSELFELESALSPHWSALFETLEGVGFRLQPLSLPSLSDAVACYHIIATAEASTNLARYDGIRYGARLQGEVAAFRGEHFGDELKRRILLGTYVLREGYAQRYYQRALRRRAQLRRDLEQALQGCDALLAPVSLETAPRFGPIDPVQAMLQDRCTTPASLAGLPALSLPWGFDALGLPFGVQLIGSRWGEHPLLGLGRVLEPLSSAQQPRRVPRAWELGAVESSVPARERIAAVECSVPESERVQSQLSGRESSAAAEEWVQAEAHSWPLVVGVEVHCQLDLQSKLFSREPAAAGASPNSLTSPMSLAQPGAMPRLNGRAVELALRAGAALGCELRRESRFERKSYAYPDLPKAYQLTQMQAPICVGGCLRYRWGDVEQRLDFERIQLEEDSGKSLHREQGSELDYNRAGVALIELVSKPQLYSAGQAGAALRALHELLVFQGVTRGRLQEGHFRVDVNLSLRAPDGSLGQRTELKNLNSFRFVEQAIEAEARRQRTLLQRGAQVHRQTLSWDDELGEVVVMREKEELGEYRFMVEPDLPTLRLDAELCEIRLWESAEDKRRRYRQSLALSQEQSESLTRSLMVAEDFDAALKRYGNEWAKRLASVYCRELVEIERSYPDGLSSAQQRSCLDAFVEGRLARGTLRSVLQAMAERGASLGDCMASLGLNDGAGVSLLESAVERVLAAEEGLVRRFRSGESKLFSVLLGKVMRELKGNMEAERVRRALEEALRG
ncbi:MAG: Asp-tRNA(Asn)/Glu-tRNA(Gln) amidotransferase subunit GatB [Myxococcota bacterium]|jgi:aspartyl-tRNA(Asn)/glutamyl-tRNA(Gln) amidotransferase subunit A|nr:Asp-tRNA(Asn)/Glu-tRNA(Gln) amidotransferase subunit GatB [Myxococcota bacterium]